MNILASHVDSGDEESNDGTCHQETQDSGNVRHKHSQGSEVSVLHKVDGLGEGSKKAENGVAND